jgi:hypothetical protein
MQHLYSTGVCLHQDTLVCWRLAFLRVLSMPCSFCFTGFFPGALAAVAAVAHLPKGPSASATAQQLEGTRMLPLWEAAVVLLHPALLLVDHGHFQYNGIALGLSVRPPPLIGLKMSVML